MTISPDRSHLRKRGLFRPDVGGGHACLLLLVAAFLWGSGNLANKTILTDIDPVSAVFLRSGIAALALLWPVWRKGTQPCSQGWVRSVAPGSLLFAFALITQQWAYQTATVTNASFLVNVTCVLTPVVGVLVWRDRLEARTVVSAALVLVGALMMTGAWASLSAMNTGDALCLVSAFFYAVWVILVGRHLQRFPTPAATTLAQCLTAALVSLPFVLLSERTAAHDWVGALPEALYLGLFSTAAAFALMAAAQTRVSPSTAAILVSAESLFGGAMGMIFLAERPSPAALVGGAVILLAILVMALCPEPSRSTPRPAPNKASLGTIS